jgi:hypothetical protein
LVSEKLTFATPFTVVTVAGVLKVVVVLVVENVTAVGCTRLPSWSFSVSVPATAAPATAVVGSVKVEFAAVGVPAMMSNSPLVAVKLNAGFSPAFRLSVAVSVSLVSGVARLSPENVAVPAVAPAAVDVPSAVVPFSVPSAADIATLADPAVNGVPLSVTVTTGVGVSGWPAIIEPAGGVVKASA